MDIQTVACPLLHNLSEQTNYGQAFQIGCFRFAVKQAVCSDSYTTKHLVRDTLRPDETADNLPYEKVGNNDPVCIADEVPFDIPDSWEWVRLGSIGDWGSGATPSRTNTEYYGGDIPWLKTGDLNDGYIKHIPESISHRALEKTSVRLNETGSVLIAMYGATIGKVGILTFPATTNQACCACLPIGIYNEYLFYFLMSQKSAFVKRGEGGAQPNISKEKIISTLMPLPSLTEQYRIVAKIKKVLPLVEQYEIAYSEVNSLNNSFPELLKKSILQEAVQGKLVPQDPNDESASVLLERIRAEKQALIKAGKIKKDKNESVIFRRDNSHYEKRGSEEVCIDEELPFEIPRNWEWCYLGDVAFVTKLAGFEYTKYIAPNLTDTGIPLFKGKNVQKGKLVFNFEGYIPEYISDELSRSQISKKCLLTPYVGTIGNIAIFDGSFKAHLGSNVGKIELINPVDRTYLSEEYVLNYLRSAAGYLQLTKHKKATAQEGISIDAIRNVIIPIPPTNEQNRIINILEGLERKVHAL